MALLAVRQRAPAITEGRPYLQPAASERRRSSWPDRLCQFVDPARTVKGATCGALPSSTSVAVLEAPGSRLARASGTPLGSARELPRATTSDKGWRAADSWTIWRPAPRAVSPTVSCGRSAPASACPGHQSSLLPLTRDTTPSTAARMYGQLIGFAGMDDRTRSRGGPSGAEVGPPVAVALPANAS
jgi:hypothetical protein